ncbi:MAG TPA: Minf_1886 family protein [Phycisphaerae bacterium]|nr:Minf_1886 family protein [Phycisphaerae bacterium]
MDKVAKTSLNQIVARTGLYPVEAFEFVRAGLAVTAQKVYPDIENRSESRQHVSGRQLCLGLRDFAIRRYGLLAKAVLYHWNVRRTADFGRIVFAMIEANLMRKTSEDSIEDFNDIFDFEAAFEPPHRPSGPSETEFNLR